LLFILLIGHPEVGTPTTSPVVDQTQSSQTAIDPMVELINAERAKNGLNALTQDDRLVASATAKACDLRDRNYWSHTDPDGNPAWPLFLENGYNYLLAGENLCKYFDTLGCMSALMSSKDGHREIILNPQYEDVGIGRCGNLIVQHFGKESK